MSRLAAIGLVGGAALVGSSSAPAAVTIGSDLAPDPDSGPACVGTNPCTLANLTVAGTPAGSPMDGVVVRWRVRSAGTGVDDAVRLKVARPTGGGAFTGVSTSATEPITDTSVATTFTFSTRQPIAADDVIALDIDGDNGNLLIRNLTPVDVSWVQWQPPLLDGQNRAPDDAFMIGEHMFNADVEPDCDGDGFGDETQDPLVSGGACPVKAAGLVSRKATIMGRSVALEVSCAAAGGNCNGNGIELRTAKKINLGKLAATAKAKRIALGSSSFSIPAGVTQTVVVPLRKAGRKLFRIRKQLRATATITGGGTSSAASLTIKARKKKG